MPRAHHSSHLDLFVEEAPWKLLAAFSVGPQPLPHKIYIIAPPTEPYLYKILHCPQCLPLYIIGVIGSTSVQSALHGEVIRFVRSLFYCFFTTVTLKRGVFHSASQQLYPNTKYQRCLLPVCGVQLKFVLSVAGSGQTGSKSKSKWVGEPDQVKPTWQGTHQVSLVRFPNSRSD